MWEMKGWSFVGGYVGEKQAVLTSMSLGLPVSFLALTLIHPLARQLAADPGLEDSDPFFGGLPFAYTHAHPQGCDADAQLPYLP